MELIGISSAQPQRPYLGVLIGVRGASESAVSGQQSKPPCGSGFNKDVFVALGTVIVILVSELLIAATLAVSTPRGAFSTEVRALYLLGGSLTSREPRPQPVSEATG